jgi:CDP-6-deoxy-D-xylo-4-hexulose-3-dehydrase
MINLVKDTINEKDIDNLIKWLKTYPRLTKHKLTIEFEKEWSKWLGTDYSIFCNSGSSAILLMLYALIQANYIKRGSQIVIPSAAWVTDLAPAMQLGFEPVLCDINFNNLSVDLNHLEEIFVRQSPSALILVSVLGLVPDMQEIVDLCDKYNVHLLEDVAESTGSKYMDKKLGTFGLMSIFSTYFGHHLSTIEGGIVCTSDYKLMNILKGLRSHGWERDMDTKFKNTLRQKWNIDDFNALYTFYYPGFNLRPTDLNAFIGLEQMKKIDSNIERRNNIFEIYDSKIKSQYWKPKKYKDRYISNFAYPIIHPKRSNTVKKLLDNNIECRPMICGSMGNQPFYVKQYRRLTLPNVSKVDRYGFYIPNHPSLKKSEINTIIDIVNETTHE